MAYTNQWFELTDDQVQAMGHTLGPDVLRGIRVELHPERTPPRPIRVTLSYRKENNPTRIHAIDCRIARDDFDKDRPTQLLYSRNAGLSENDVANDQTGSNQLAPVTTSAIWVMFYVTTEPGGGWLIDSESSFYAFPLRRPSWGPDMHLKAKTYHSEIALISEFTPRPPRPSLQNRHIVRLEWELTPQDFGCRNPWGD